MAHSEKLSQNKFLIAADIPLRNNEKGEEKQRKKSEDQQGLSCAKLSLVSISYLFHVGIFMVLFHVGIFMVSLRYQTISRYLYRTL